MTGTSPVLGAVLLGVAVLASSLAGWLLRRGRRDPSRAGPASDGVSAGVPAVLCLLVAAVAAATGAAALSDGTWGPQGWWPFAGGLALACLPLMVIGTLRR